METLIIIKDRTINVIQSWLMFDLPSSRDEHEFCAVGGVRDSEDFIALHLDVVLQPNSLGSGRALNRNLQN